MRDQIFSVSFTVLLFFLLAGWASADEVWLKNGDHISGKVVALKDGTLSFTTSYAGELSIQWEDVTSLKTDDPVEVVLDDATRSKGPIVPGKEGEVMVTTEEAANPEIISLASVRTFNPKENPVKIKTKINVGVLQERGNSYSDDIRIDADFFARTEKSRYGVGGEFHQEKSNEITTVDNWKAFANYDYFFAKRWYWYGLGRFKNNDFKDLRLRTTLGVGIGYQFFESDLLYLSFSTGPAYIDKDYILAPDDNFPAAHWNLKYEQYFFDKSLQLFHSSYGYLHLDDSEDWTVDTRQGFRFPIYKGFTGTIQYSYDFENKPSRDAITDYDSSLSFHLGYEFEK
ncbi:MAG: DUF481 domain-containing protein [Thermodesulfobacteriota bacterium]